MVGNIVTLSLTVLCMAHDLILSIINNINKLLVMIRGSNLQMHYLNNFCCLCLSPNQNLKNILSEDNDGVVVEKKLKLFLFELVSFKPHIHKYVCNNCLLNLNHIYKFKLMCLKNMTSLREHVQKLEAAESSKNIQLQYERYRTEFENQKHSKTNNHDIENVCLQSNVVEETNSNKDDTEETSSTVQNNVNLIEQYNEINTPVQVFIKTEIDEKVETDDSYLSFNEDVQEKSQDVIVKTENQDPFENFQAPYESFKEFNEEKYIEEDVMNTYNYNMDTAMCGNEFEEEKLPSVSKLPQKSRTIYEKEYKCFQKWKIANNINGISEPVLVAYFSEKSKKAKSSTLWSYYSMLKSTLLVNDKCDISKYSQLITLLKKLSDGYKPKKSSTFEANDIIRFLKEASDDQYLFMKVVAIMGLCGACRSDELYNLNVSNVDDRQSVMVVSLIDTKTQKDRSFCITDKGCEVKVLEIVRKYIALRPAHVPHTKFFLHYRQKKCNIQSVGINTMYKVPKMIADFLKLPNSEMYTGHCFRRSASVGKLWC